MALPAKRLAVTEVHTVESAFEFVELRPQGRESEDGREEKNLGNNTQDAENNPTG